MTRSSVTSSTAWNLYAALYHFMTKWHDMHLKLRMLDDRYLVPETGPDREAVLDRFVEDHGKPPYQFHSIDNRLGVAGLPSVQKSGPLYETLLRRRTTRAFDASRPLDAEDLSTVLLYVFGCHGRYTPHKNIHLLKKTSPSGGALHPIEVYPLVQNVRGLASGLYHYNVEHHELELIELIDAGETAEIAGVFTAGQSFARDAHVLFVLTARFQRNFWKYRKHEKAYRALLLDAGHLSQTLYLVCTELGLGAFVTAAINDVNIEERLGLDGFDEGVLAILGCGIPGPRNADLDPVFESYVPGQTRL
jgi:putative peptide maturation dehydrogenase